MPGFRDAPVRVALAALALLLVVPVILLTLAAPVLVVWFTLRSGAHPAAPVVGGSPFDVPATRWALPAAMVGVGLVLAGQLLGGPSGDPVLAAVRSLAEGLRGEDARGGDAGDDPGPPEESPRRDESADEN